MINRGLIVDTPTHGGKLRAPIDHKDCLIQGKAIPINLLGDLRETTFRPDGGKLLRQRLCEDGYLFLRDVIDSSLIDACRDEVFSRLAEVGEIKSPPREGIFTGTSRRRELAADLGEFWRSVSEGPALRAVSHGAQIQRVLDTILGEAARPQDYLFLRPGVVDRATNLHYDFPFFARGSKRTQTVWTALGDIPTCDGPLVVVENSHRFRDLIDPILETDYESAESPQVAITASAVELARGRGSRLLTASFEPGDVIVFTMTTLHGTLDNHSPIGRTRLSCDVRWQPLADPIDSRYVGVNPSGTTGAGYAELNGAKPLDLPWHVR